MKNKIKKEKINLVPDFNTQLEVGKVEGRKFYIERTYFRPDNGNNEALVGHNVYNFKNNIGRTDLQEANFIIEMTEPTPKVIKNRYRNKDPILKDEEVLKRVI